MSARVQVSVDTGGTFSDFTYFDREGVLHSFKVPSTPKSPETAVITGLDRIIETGIAPNEIDIFIHGTTVGTNALLQEKGAKTALVITEGFDAVYEVQEQARPYGAEIFNIRYQRPKLLVDRAQVVEVPERVGSRGEIVRALDLETTRSRLQALVGQDIQAVAVCLLFSFLNAEHERQVKALVEEVLPGVPVTISSALCPFIREYYRMSTTIINAYLRPVMDRYLSELDRAMSSRGMTSKKRYVMQSNGGVASLTATAERPVATLMSGLAGGVMASLKILNQAGISSGISFDMGGTSCDVAVNEGVMAEIRDRFEIEGRHVCLPSVQVETLSAGGGTMAWVDEHGLLHVGPESAGAMPGPVAYGQGGETPTITDCNVVLGYLGDRPEVKAHLSLQPELARQAIQDKIATPLQLDVNEAALGILKIIDIKMSEAIRALATSKGLDLRDFTLVSFGGAGPLHSSRIMRELGLKQVLIPAKPGVTSALGLLHADVKHEFIQTKPTALASLSGDEFTQTLSELVKQAEAFLVADGFSDSEISTVMQVDLRYQGQGYELSVEVGSTQLDRESLRAAFDAMHERKFGHAATSQPVELMAYRVTGVGHPSRTTSAFEAAAQVTAEQVEGTPSVRTAIFEVDGRWKSFETPIYQRHDLVPGQTYLGPMVIEQADTTTLVVPDQSVVMDAYGNILIRDV
ncbi:MAG: hydantoinase/oxoprolinase family protein [Litorivicinaceae bacterium]